MNAQYCLRDEVVIRTLDVLEVTESQTACVLKQKALEKMAIYGISLQQIFSITVDNGANMLAAVRKMKDEFTMLHSMEDIGDIESSGSTEVLITELGEMFKERLNLVRCAAHTLQLAILDVVDKSNDAIKRVTDIAIKSKNVKYMTNFVHHNATYPPVWCQTRWGGIYLMMRSFFQQKSFFEQLSKQFPELNLVHHWQFIQDYTGAFQPVYHCSKTIQESHVSLSEFHVTWPITIGINNGNLEPYFSVEWNN
ncbi:uncharacterized protein LOC129721119 isoform X2 [Wyeomyia smithii]|uniref:uncharacterized protein LOC129721119 isoform X2 n=1 Tax=Wyeomyia smithii TaxID=174621 RepID=UPI002467B6D3|nr:uncharacterized protein LOC129721119 isoform X2 [Wyeomyia smithii]